MKAIKIIYRILYIIFGICWILAISSGIYEVLTTGKFQVFDTLPYYGIEAYFQAILLYSMIYLYIAWLPLLIAVILHIAYKMLSRKAKKQHQEG